VDTAAVLPEPSDLWSAQTIALTALILPEFFFIVRFVAEARKRDGKEKKSQTILFAGFRGEVHARLLKKFDHRALARNHTRHPEQKEISN
jgi:hypothetical protein